MKELFKNPPREYSISPFWFWNDGLALEHLKWQMDEMIAKGIYTCSISSRLGIEIDYLSDEWFERMEYVVKYAAEIGLSIWLYDEDNWPSGYAGGKVLGENPDYCGKHIKRFVIQVEEGFTKEEITSKVVSCFVKTEGRETYIDWDSYVPVNGDTLKLFCQEYTLWNPAYFTGYYPDMLNPLATKCFIKHTHQIYLDRMKEYMGNVIKGFFVDEPGFYNNLHIFPTGDDDTVPWTDEFATYFQEKNGYDMEQCMIHLWDDVDETTADIRVDFYETLCSMYKENFLDILRDFCNDNGMLLIGHLHYEEFMNYHIATQGNFMRALESLDVIGLDRIDTNEEKIAEKYASSAAHLDGGKRVMSETYALSGWELTLQEMKRWVNYQYVRGVNMLVPHAFYSSIEGARSEECPPSEFYQNPYWKYFSQYSDYANRLSYILSQGIHRCNVALYYPIATMQKNYIPQNVQIVKEKDKKYQEVAMGLLNAQIDYDIITKEKILESVMGAGTFGIGDAQYKTLILTQVEYLSSEEVMKIHELVANGCKLVICDDMPDYFSDIKDNGNVMTVPKAEQCYIYTNKRNMNAIKTFLLENQQLELLVDDKDEKIKYMHRIMDKHDYYFIINEEAYAKKVRVKISGAWNLEEWDVESGDVKAINSKVYHYPNYYLGATSTGAEWIVNAPCTFTELTLDLCEYGSKLLKLKEYKEVEEYPEQQPAMELTMNLQGIWNVKMGEEHVLSQSLSLQALGRMDFSGTFVASKKVVVPETLEYSHAYLVADGVKDCMELHVNDKECGYRSFAPYRLEITEALRKGENTITVHVTNSIINELRNLPHKGGIYGDIKIIFQ